MLPFAAIGPIKGRITGKPIKTDDFTADRGGGNSLRGGRGGATLGGKHLQKNNRNNNKWSVGSGKGRGVRTLFRGGNSNKPTAPTRSRSRSRSVDSSSSSTSSSEYSHSKKSKRRRRYVVHYLQLVYECNYLH